MGSGAEACWFPLPLWERVLSEHWRAKRVRGLRAERVRDYPSPGSVSLTRDLATLSRKGKGERGKGKGERGKGKGER